VAANEAEVTPEAMTAMVTMKLRMPMWKARWTYRAAPAARGYLVTSSR
jgi:hypothetical protein